ncbi:MULTISPECIES: rhamnulokinase [Actinoalloteichus]|uniref:Pentulose/hexulose kinase n=1 Tax=Actinoalloteichus fjordicus TaxID=1612552 RepID=A0AAC9LFL4_9PSEU|nr:MULTISPECIES: rhamnulokinase family protein [Actinoalloteichus]APU16786.1 pentulose/hexulose kinase [Actinoalloteichus fjordicus]APU22851.1 pentulose/hexulose kinase [Actinoalloteichus sp. GBA129-24]
MSTSGAVGGAVTATCAAVDLGASSGRVILGRVGAGELSTTEVARFDNTPIRIARGAGRDRLHWNVLGLYRDILAGLRIASASAELHSIGIDSWAVDYGLLDADGELLGNPIHYRDSRTDGVLDQVRATLGAERIYATTGIQFMPINTLIQLVAARDTAALTAASSLLLIPDLLCYWLTGQRGAEVTNASTTQLLDVRRREWAWELVRAAGIDETLLPPLREPGERIGLVDGTARAELGGGELPVVAVGSHDTASAIVAVPTVTRRFGYVSCGTWSLVGLELDAPVVSEAGRTANFTNELGVDGTTRYLRNVMGLWLLQESLRTWADAGRPAELSGLLADAARAEPFRSIVDPDDPRFLAPGDMPARIAQACRETGQPVPETQAQLVRCVLESLALAYRRTLRQACALSGREVDVLHIVGGGSRNELLCRLTADACGIPVVAGPVEATALGNLLVQARAAGGSGVGDLTAMRALVAATQEVREYAPSGAASDFDAAARRLD